MRILQVHNQYQNPGGEDTVQQAELWLLRKYGHEVDAYIVNNQDLSVSGFGALRAGVSTVWSQGSLASFRKVLKLKRPDIIHVHNTFPQLSPSVYWAARLERVPVVQTLHNYRLTCANGLLLRNDSPCELCVHGSVTAALKYRCYRNSIAATGAVVAMQTVHHALGTYRTKVDAYIALTGFARSIMVRAGLPDDRVYVKPNFLDDPLAVESTLVERENRIVFVGRITKEKGVDLLLQAWSQLKDTEWKLLVVGDGPERAELQSEFRGLRNVVWSGWLGRGEVLATVARSRYLVISSRWYEGFPMVLVEAMAVGTPIIVPSHGPFPEVAPDSDQLAFEPGNSTDLTKVLASAIGTARWTDFRRKARTTYETSYTPEVNYHQLMTIYEHAKETHQKTCGNRPPSMA